MSRLGAWNLDQWRGRADRYDVPSDYGLYSDKAKSAIDAADTAYDAAVEAEETIGAIIGCYETSSCPSGYACIGGTCQRSKPFGGQGSAGTGNCEPVSPPVSPACGGYGCVSPSCGDEGGRDCCGGTIYTCFGGVTQCEPCEDDGECNSFCDSHYQTFGDLSEGCTQDDVCVCGDCMSGTCRESLINSNCNCDRAGEAPECEVCNKATGDYEEDCTQCNQVYSIQNFQCPYPNQAHTVSGSLTLSSCPQPGVSRSGYNILQDQLREKCKQFPEKPQSSCKAQSECEANCVCVSNSWRAGIDPAPQPSVGALQSPCPSGKQCTTVGTAFIQGALTQVTTRICDRLPDCGCQNPTTPCGECEVCVNDECVYDQANCENCQNDICSGTCCDIPGPCVPGIKYRALDLCHGQTQEFCAPVGASVTLGPPFVILASQAICNRYHTHCSILINGRDTGRMTLDCQTGIQSLGQCDGLTCPG